MKYGHYRWRLSQPHHGAGPHLSLYFSKQFMLFVTPHPYWRCHSDTKNAALFTGQDTPKCLQKIKRLSLFWNKANRALKKNPCIWYLVKKFFWKAADKFWNFCIKINLPFSSTCRQVFEVYDLVLMAPTSRRLAFLFVFDIVLKCHLFDLITVPSFQAACSLKTGSPSVSDLKVSPQAKEGEWCICPAGGWVCLQEEQAVIW